MGNSVNNDLPVVKYDTRFILPTKIPAGTIIECEGVLFTVCWEESPSSRRIIVIRTPMPPR